MNLVDDLGHQVKPALGTRRVALVEIALITFGHRVFAQRLRHIQRMRHRLDMIGPGRIKLGHEIDDPRQIVDVTRDLLIRDPQSGQMCDVLDLMSSWVSHLPEDVAKGDQIFPWFIATQLPVGLKGLIIAARLRTARATRSPEAELHD